MPGPEPLVRVTQQRRLTLPLLTFYGLGTIVGADIYVLIGAVAQRAGLYAPAAFLTSALIAGLTAHSYAELSARFPKSAGEALYVRLAFASRTLATLTGFAVIVTGVVSAATIANGFAGYLGVFLDNTAWVVISLFIAGHHLERRGLLERDEEQAWLSGEEGEVGPLDELLGASITYRIAVGAQRGEKAFMLRTLPPTDEESVAGDRVARVAGFSLHAGIAARADQRTKVERLCRYIARPAVAEPRLSLT